MDDRDLLQCYLRDKSADAYAEVVRRNIDLVYAAACRQLGDAHLAEDVTQAVFILFTRKAAAIDRSASLAGWLIKATHYACRDARRLAARREFHERQAMKSRPEQAAGAEAQWEEYAPYLDESLARLAAADRDVLTLRYLRGLALKEVSAAQRISEEAARKRVDRALLRLRKVMSRRLTVPAAAVFATGVAATLGASAAHAAPLALSQTIIASGTAASRASVHLIAGAAQKSLWLLKAKLVLAVTAATVVGLTTVAATTAILYKTVTPKPAAPAPQFVAASVPAQPTPAANPDENESTVPGQIQCARWDVLLDAAELPNLQKIAKPLKTTSTIYNAYVATGVDLRRAVRNAIDAGTFESATHLMAFADLSIMDTDQTVRFYHGLNVYTEDNTRNGIVVNGGSTDGPDAMTRIAGGRAHLKISHPDLHVSIAQLTRNTRWINQPGQSIAYEGDLSPGQAVVFIGQLPTVAGRDFVHLIVCETFQADRQQMPVIDRQSSAQWWCENGPARLRQWANAARLWTAQATHPSDEVAAPFQVTLEDGQIVCLEGLCQPAQWPFCWWDAEGNPVEGDNGALFVNGDLPDALWVYLTVTSTNPEEPRRMRGLPDDPSQPVSADGSKNVDNYCEKLADESNVDFGIDIGPWKQIGTLEMDIPQTINGVTYTIRRPLQFNTDGFLIHFIRQGVLDNDDLLVPVDANGKSPEDISPREAIVQGHKTSRQRSEATPNFYGIHAADVKEWRVMQRKRQWITFTNFATRPKNPPPAQATREDAITAEKLQKQREDQAASDAIIAQRKEWAAIPPDCTTIRGTIRALIDAMRAGDEPALRKMLIATKPQAEACIPEVARYSIVGMQAHQALVDALGRDVSNDTLYSLSPGRGCLLIDPEADLFNGEWKTTAPGRAEKDDYRLDKDPDGHYRLNLDPLADMPNAQEMFKTMTLQEEQLRDTLRKKSHVTLGDVKTMLDDLSETPQK